MRKTLLFITLAFGLAGCKNLPRDDTRSCDKLMDWNDRKACKEKVAAEQRDWEKRDKK
ncbi:lipoprotein [Massilia sp. METH4]|uniref:lipoprotein n=1 Tax=Massilia sp. METH4 TaxID=3123041 RepID=UPI0030D16FF0